MLIICFPHWNIGHGGGFFVRSHVPRWCLQVLRYIGYRPPARLRPGLSQSHYSWLPFPTRFPPLSTLFFCSHLALLLPAAPWLLSVCPVAASLHLWDRRGPFKEAMSLGWAGAPGTPHWHGATLARVARALKRGLGEKVLPVPAGEGWCHPRRGPPHLAVSSPGDRRVKGVHLNT